MHFNTGYCINLKDIHSRTELHDLVFKLNTFEGYSLPLITVDDMMHELYDVKSFYRYLGVNSYGCILFYSDEEHYMSIDDSKYDNVVPRSWVERYINE